MKLKLKDIKQIVEGVVKNALFEEEDPRFGRYKSSMTKTFETVDIEKATRKHAQAMGELSAALKDALSVGGAVKVMEISKQMEELNRQLEQEIEAIIRSNDADARPMEEQEAPAAPETAQPAVDQKADVGVVLKYIEKINNIQEYVQLLEAVLAHTPAGDENLKKRALLAVFKKLGIATSAVKKVAGE